MKVFQRKSHKKQRQCSNKCCKWQLKSASAQILNVLLKSTDDSTPPVTVPPATVPECNFITKNELSLSLITMIGRCPACIGSINIEHLLTLLSEKMGLAQFLNIYCNDCGLKQKYRSSKEFSRDPNSLGRNSFDLNKRALIAFRENGQGYAAMTTFCRCMNIPPPMMAQTTFHKLNSDLNNAYVQTAPPKRINGRRCKNYFQ